MSSIFSDTVSQSLLEEIFKDSAKWGWVEEDPSPFVSESKFLIGKTVNGVYIPLIWSNKRTFPLPLVKETFVSWAIIDPEDMRRSFG